MMHVPRFVHALCALALGAAMPLQAAVTHFETFLNAAAELPVPAIPDGFNPTGKAFGSYDSDSNELYLEVDWAGLTSDLQAGHFHIGKPSGPVFIPLEGLPTATSGTYQHVFNLDDAQETSFMNALKGGSLYVNLHTKVNPSGEIRGFLAPVPEPEAAALMGLGLIGVGVARLGRRRSS